MKPEKCDAAAEAIANCDALLIGAGAGMGVDSGLPDFRGDKGFWRAYPPMEKLGLSFHEMADPVWFVRDPTLAWGFYGHRMNLYNATQPHAGFAQLLQIAGQRRLGCHVFTSNVDGHFQRSGFRDDQVVECHGSINHLQCAEPCCDEIWEANETDVVIDEATFRAAEPLPECKYCGGLARPNVLMFGDAHWVEDRTRRQTDRYSRWLVDFEPGTRMVAIEFGAGTAVPTVRYEMERQTRGASDTLIRVNPREYVLNQGISLMAGAAEAIAEIAKRLESG